MTKTDLIRVDRSTLDPASLRELDDMDRIFKEAVAGARADNRQLGLPSYSTEAGDIVEELPDGTIQPIGETTSAAGVVGRRSRGSPRVTARGRVLAGPAA